MSIQIDPEQNEIRALKKAVQWTERDVLEVGCGDGRLAGRVAGLGASVTAIDPGIELVRSAGIAPKEIPNQNIRYTIGDGQQLPFSGESFDIVVLGWAL